MAEIDISQILVLLTIIANGVIASIVIRNNPKSETNLSLAFFTVSIALWTIPNYLYASVENYDQIVFWMRSVFFVTGFMLGFLAYFSLVFPHVKWKVPLITKFSILLPSLIIALASYTDLIVTEADISGENNIPVFGAGMIFYFVYVFIYIGITLFALRKRFTESKDYLIRRQILIIAVALGILTIPASFTNLVMVFVFRDTSLTALGPAFSLITFSLISYTIIRHRFLDIRLLLGRVIYYLIAAAFPFIAFYLIAIIYTQLFGGIFAGVAVFLSTFIAVGFVIGFQEFNRFIREQVTLRFINPGFDPLESADRFGNEVSTLLNISEISSKLIDNMSRTLKPDFANLIVFEQETNNISFMSKATDKNYDKVNILKEVLLTLWNNSNPEAIAVDFIDDASSIAQYGNMYNLVNNAKSGILELGAKVALPLSSKDKINGIILIGKKESDIPYTVGELDYLKSIGTTISVAIERSLLYSEVQQFADTLQGKVDEATEELQNRNSQLQTALNQLREVRRRERDMIDVMGHELRTPMSIVRNALSLLEREYEKHDGNIEKEKLHKYLEMGVESAKREVTLIETLLSATKVDASRVQLHLVKVDFKDVINDAIEGQRNFIKEKKLNLNYHKPPEDIFVYCDRTRVQQIMDNFLSNAAKYTQKGNIDLNIWTNSDFGWISVSDSGIGIDGDDLQNLGKKFFRAKQYINTNGQEDMDKIIRPGGTGLGLYVTFELIRLMGGQLYINSIVNQGTTFTWSMPLFKGQEEQQIDQTFDTSDTGNRESRDFIVINGNPPKPPQ